MPGETHLLSQAPTGWTNAVPADPGYSDLLSTCTGLIKSSTATSKINDSIDTGVYDRNIRRLRAALWLTTDSQVTIAFNVLEGPTKNHAERCPKFVVCAGITLATYNNLSSPFSTADPTYQLIRNAVIYFEKNNQDHRGGRVHLCVEQNNQPMNGDYIYPIFQLAINNDIAIKEGSTAAESPGGVPEDYSNQAQSTSPPRWPNSLTSWKLKRWQDA